MSQIASAPQPAPAHPGEMPGEQLPKKKRRKVNHACLYCRRSHMTCDDGRPCQRCIKREIGHLCRDEIKATPSSKSADKSTISPISGPGSTAEQPAIRTAAPGDSGMPQSSHYSTMPAHHHVSSSGVATPQSWTPLVQSSGVYPGSDGLGNEFSVLTEFLESLDDRSFFGAPQTGPLGAGPTLSQPRNPSYPDAFGNGPTMLSSSQAGPSSQFSGGHQPHHQPPQRLDPYAFGQNQAPAFGPPMSHPQQQPQPHTSGSQHFTPQAQQPQGHPAVDAAQHGRPLLPPLSIPDQYTHSQQHSADYNTAQMSIATPTKTERFFLTAADQQDGTRDERLAKVIHSKYEAGLLKPWKYSHGYARLMRWMERNVTPEARQQILQPLSVLRPKFRAVAQSLTDVDLVFIEEAFERLLLDYDRVFASMGIPACLWRRTGEIFKGNTEFAKLIGVDPSDLLDGRLTIYEMMSEDSAVNFFEKYGQVAFDTGQKAVLTSCVLKYKPTQDMGQNTQYINCCFSFTIRRDAWGIPTAIIGNFLTF